MEKIIALFERLSKSDFISAFAAGSIAAQAEQFFM